MSRVVMGPSKIEGRICPRTRVEDRGRYLGIPRTERFRILECPGNRVRYSSTKETSAMSTYESLSHSKVDCKYHVVFVPGCN
jgi:hypothetical protein